MEREWPLLSKPPIILDLFQIKFSEASSLPQDIANEESKIGVRKNYPNRHDNLNSNIQLDKFPDTGISTIKAKANTRLETLIYTSEDKKNKVAIDDKSFTISSEMEYKDWATFSSEIKKILEMFALVMKDIHIERISIRFVNRIRLNLKDDLTEYVNATVYVNQNNMPYPQYDISKFGFKIMYRIPNSPIYAIVNQNIDPQTDYCFYILDLDVLKPLDMSFNVDSIIGVADELRGIRNNIFFNNVTDKLIELCQQ